MFARLLGLRRQDDWNSMCETTPALVRGQNLDGPTYCEDKVGCGRIAASKLVANSTCSSGRAGHLWRL